MDSSFWRTRDQHNYAELSSRREERHGSRIWPSTGGQNHPASGVDAPRRQPQLLLDGKSATPEALREKLAQAIWAWAYPTDDEPDPPTYRDWGQFFKEFARLIDASKQPLIAVWDEFSFAVEADRSLPSFLQEAWDHCLKDKPLTLVLAGSHIGMMVDLAQYKQPLYGRITARLPIEPLPYPAIQDFLPKLSSVSEQLRAYMGGGAFEEICREWHQIQAQKQALLFEPELIGSEWNSEAQVDVAAVNHREKVILLGECKWTGDRIRRDVITELVYEKSPKVHPSKDWTVHYYFFSRSGYTPEALKETEQHAGHAVTFAQVDKDLRQHFLTTSSTDIDASPV